MRLSQIPAEALRRRFAREKLEREVARRLVSVDVEACRRLVQRIERQHPNRKAAHKAIVHYWARRAAVRGFIIGLPASPLTSLPLTFVEITSMWRLKVELATCLVCLHAPALLESDDWRLRVLTYIVGQSAFPTPSHGQPHDATANKACPHAGLKDAGKAWFHDRLVRRLRRRTRRTLLSKTVPLVGGVVSSAWNYAECRNWGERFSGLERGVV